MDENAQHVEERRDEPLMKNYQVWNLWDRISIDGKKYNSLEKAVEASRKYLLRFVGQGYYACAQRDAISFYGQAEGSINAHIPLNNLQVYVVDDEDVRHCLEHGSLDDVGHFTLLKVRLPMNPIHENVVMGGEKCRAVAQLSDDISNDLLYDMVELWNDQRHRNTDR
jgi:hypothetical protein